MKGVNLLNSNKKSLVATRSKWKIILHIDKRPKPVVTNKKNNLIFTMKCHFSISSIFFFFSMQNSCDSKIELKRYKITKTIKCWRNENEKTMNTKNNIHSKVHLTCNKFKNNWNEKPFCNLNEKPTMFALRWAFHRITSIWVNCENERHGKTDYVIWTPTNAENHKKWKSMNRIKWS